MIQWGTVSEALSGFAAAGAAMVALRIAKTDRRLAHFQRLAEVEREDRRRAMDRVLRLLSRIELDRTAMGDADPEARDPEAILLARLHNQGLVYEYYVKPDEFAAHLSDRGLGTEELFVAMREELIGYFESLRVPDIDSAREFYQSRDRTARTFPERVMAALRAFGQPG